MTKFTRLLLSLSLVMLGSYLYAQEPVKDCKDIKVEAKAKDPNPGASDGTIDLLFDEPIQNYKVFWVNAGRDKTGKVELESSRLENLRAGFFDFLIIHKTKKACVRQLTVTLN